MNIGKYGLAALIRIVSSPLGVFQKTTSALLLDSEFKNLHCMPHKMRRAKNTSCSRCGTEKETSEHFLCEYRVLEKIMMQTLGFTKRDFD